MLNRIILHRSVVNVPHKMSTILIIILDILVLGSGVSGQLNDQLSVVTFDLTNPTTWEDMTEYYTRSEKPGKFCYMCGFPKMGTTIHYQYFGSNSPKPAAVAVDYLLTRLVVIDVSFKVKHNPNFELKLGDAYRLLPKDRDTYRATLLVFKFGWADHPSYYNQNTNCSCQIPGISFELAAFIAVNLGHVVGIGTDTPSLESDETRQTTTKTVSGILGNSGIYIIENVEMTQKIPDKGCLAMVLPLKILDENYVPARLIAMCPPLHRNGAEIILAQGDARKPPLKNQNATAL